MKDLHVCERQTSVSTNVRSGRTVKNMAKKWLSRFIKKQNPKAAGKEKSCFRAKKWLVNGKRFAGTGCDPISRRKRSAEQGRGGIVTFCFPGHPLRAEIGVAIFTAIFTGVVGAHVNAFDTAAAGALVLVFFGRQGMPQELFDPLPVDAAAMLDSIGLEIHGFAAGFHGHVVTAGDGGELGSQNRNLF